MFKRIIYFVVVIPLAVLLVVLAVANRAATPFTIDPFDTRSPSLTIEWPLFVYLMIALILGVIIGSVITWFRQGRYRRLARERTQETERLRREAAARNERSAPMASLDANDQRYS